MNDTTEFLIVGGVATFWCAIGACGAKASLTNFLTFVISLTISLAIIWNMVTHINAKHRVESQPQIAREWR